MAKKIKPLSKMNTFNASKHRRNIMKGQHNTVGDFNTIQRQEVTAHEICFICLKNHGQLTISGRYVCSRCRREWWSEQ